MPKNWSKEIQIPTNNEYVVRCIEETFAPSSKGNPMITLKFEIVSPQTVTALDGEEVNVAGLKMPYYANVAIFENGELNAEKTAQARTYTFKSEDKDRPALYEIAEIEVTPEQYDNPPLGFKGKCFAARVKPDPQVVHDSPTAADLKAGKREGKVSINPRTKKPMQTFYPKIETLYCVVSAPGSGSPFGN